MIDILLATYNGGEYIGAFLQSLQSQTYTDWRLLVRDDGSTDDTLEQIQTLTQGWHQEVVFVEGGDHTGAKNSFEQLLMHSENEYCAFADQDDIWRENKLAVSVSAMCEAESVNAGKAIVVHTDLQVVDSELKTISESFWKYSNLRPELIEGDIHYLAISNCLTGCTMLMNKPAREVSLPFASNAAMHDAWVGISTLLSGGVIVALHEQTVLYRQHSDNVYGAKKYTALKLRGEESNISKARKSYTAASPQVFGSVISFLLWKIRYFISQRIKR